MTVPDTFKLASRPSPAWTRTRRSLQPRWQRRAALGRQKTLAGKLAREQCVVRSPVPQLPHDNDDFASALDVFVVAAPPDARLVAPLGGAVEPLVHAPEAVQSARIGGIGVVDDAVLEHERAHAWPLARVRGHVGAGHRRALGSAFGCRPRGYIGNRPRRRAPVVVFDGAGTLLLLGDR